MIREIDGKEYNFKLTRRGIRAAERAGMSMSTVADRPMDSVYLLWYAALHQTHPMVMSKTDDLLDKYLDQKDCPESFEDILETLMTDYTEVFGVAAE